MSEFEKELYKKRVLRNIVEFMLLGLIIYFTRDLFNLFLLTFLFSYLICNLQKFIADKIHLHKTIIAIFLYLSIIGLMGFFVCKYIPEIIDEIQMILKEMSKVDIPDKWAKYLTEQIDMTNFYNKFVNTILNIGTSIVQSGLSVFISLTLSMFFVLDKEKITKFICKFKTSKISFIYTHIEYFGMNFLNSFGKVIQVQFLIALINSIISVIALWFIGFPQLMGLGFMVFVLSFIPIAGTIISLIPLSLIAFNVGGLIKVIYVIIMISLIHCLESYVLNPKLMSDKTSLPIFFIFIILIVGKHLIGIWGLLLGIPIFIVIMDVLGVKTSDNLK